MSFKSHIYYLYVQGLRKYEFVNETTPHRFICLCAWFLVGGTVLERTGMCGLLGGGVSIEVKFKVKKIITPS